MAKQVHNLRDELMMERVYRGREFKLLEIRI